MTKMNAPAKDTSSIQPQATKSLFAKRNSAFFDVVLPLAFAGSFVFACAESVPDATAKTPEGDNVARVTAPVIDAGSLNIVGARPMDGDTGSLEAYNADAFGVVDTMVMAQPSMKTLFDREMILDEDNRDADANQLLTRADVFRGNKDIKNAIMDTRRALYHQNDSTVWAKLGELYMLDRQDDRAIDCYEEALAHDETLTKARLSVARLYLDAGSAEEAAFHATQLKGEQENEGRYLLGRSFMARNMWKEAIDELAVVAEREPTNPYVHNNLGFSALQIGENEVAVDHLEAVLAAKAKRPYMMNNLGLAYERTERPVEALAAYQHAIEMRPRYTNAIVNRDRVITQLTDDEIALAAEISDDFKNPVVAETEDVLAAALAPEGEPVPAE